MKKLLLSAVFAFATSPVLAAMNNADLTCRPTKPVMQEAYAIVEKTPSLSILFFTGDQARVYLEIINRAEPNSEFQADAIFGMQGPGGAQIALFSADTQELCLAIQVDMITHARALRVIGQGV
jgi:hypothetical protein